MSFLFCFSADVFLVLLAILFPPLPVWIKRGICSADSLINIALCMLGFLPGLLHSWYIIARFPEEPFIDPRDLEAQEFSRINGRAGVPVAYSRAEFVYSPIPQTDGAAIAHPHSPAPQETGVVAAPAPAPATQQQDPLIDLAGPSTSTEVVPPPYEEYEGQNVKDHKIQLNDNQ
ncbi:hypothetical protein BZA70DRAFT_267384 [Myxozyma melibiosi]|uniref:Stress response RCI peptide n=1 Tax=Myxozyma melibiosi TaxID=54550 RepID=A0ABR1F6T1_9ASCO